MGAYDIYNDPQIDPTLYADMTLAGIKAGRESPSMTTSIISGALSGMEEGQKLYTGWQQQELNDERLAQMQLQTERMRYEQSPDVIARTERRADLQNQMLNDQLQVYESKMNLAKATQEYDQSAQIAKDRAVTEQNNYQANLLHSLNEFDSAFPTADAQTQHDMIFGGQYSSLFAQMPQKRMSALESYINRPEVQQNPDLLDQAQYEQERMQILQSNKVTSNAAAKTYQGSLEKAGLDSLQPSKWGYDKEGMLRSITITPKDQFQRNGDYYMTDPVGQRIRYPENDLNHQVTTKPDFEISIPDPNNPNRQRIIGTLPNDAGNNLIAAKQRQAEYEGSTVSGQMKRLNQKYDRIRTMRQQAAGTSDLVGPPEPTPQSPIMAMQPAGTQVSFPDFVSTRLPMDAPTFTELGPQWKAIQDWTVQYQSDPSYRLGLAGAPVTAMNAVVNTIAEKEWQKDATLRDAYAQKVVTYNRMAGSSRGDMLWFGGSNEELSAHDLFIQDRSAAIRALLDAAVARYRKNLSTNALRMTNRDYENQAANSAWTQ